MDTLAGTVARLIPQGRGGGPELAAEAAKLKAGDGGTDDVFVKLEVAFRRELQHRMRKGSGGVDGLIQLCIGFAEAAAEAAAAASQPVPATGKLPFLLFEDLLDGSPLEDSSDAQRWSARRAWALLEECSEPLCSAALFGKGKNVLLRFCNGLLRRLSKSFDTEWCGKVLMFLTAACPLSERSAVNVKGEVNTDNVTAIENEEVAKFEADGVDEAEPGEGDEGRSQQPSADYETYSSLWGLQRWLASPHLALASAAEWGGFLGHAAAVLTAFERHGFKEHELAMGREAHEAQRRAEPGDCTGAADAPLGPSGSSSSGASCKYLTTSRLLRTQLVDPSLRLHLVTQVTIFLAHVRSSAVPNYASLVAGKPRPATQAATAAAAAEGGGGGAAKEPVDDAEDRRALEPSALEADCAGLEARLAALLARTPPNGPDFARTLGHVVRHEAVWAEWKDKSKCAPYERAAVDCGKRKAGEEAGGSVLKQAAAAVKAQKLGGLAGGLEGSSTIGARKPVPSLAEHMELYLDCEDPEQVRAG